MSKASTALQKRPEIFRLHLSSVPLIRCVLPQRLAAITSGSIPWPSHQARSLPRRWSSRWCSRQMGTVNRSLTFRPHRARFRKLDIVRVRRCSAADHPIAEMPRTSVVRVSRSITGLRTVDAERSRARDRPRRDSRPGSLPYTKMVFNVRWRAQILNNLWNAVVLLAFGRACFCAATF